MRNIAVLLILVALLNCGVAWGEVWDRKGVTRYVTYTGVIQGPLPDSPFRLGSVNGRGPLYTIFFRWGDESGKEVRYICEEGDICTVTGVANIGGIFQSFDRVDKVVLVEKYSDYKTRSDEDTQQLLERLSLIRKMANDLME